MIDVLLSQSYFMHFDPKQERAMMPYPPLGTLYAAAVLEAEGYGVQLFDTMLARSEEEVRGTIASLHPRMFVIYDDDFNYLTKMCLTRMREAAFAMTRIAKQAGALVVVHGSDASDHADAYLAHGADAVMIGESETTLLELCGRLLRDDGRGMNAIDGLAYAEDGVVRRTRMRAIRRQLDDMPFPAWHLVDHERYRDVWKKRHGYYSVNMVTTRGCPYHCNWCAKPVYGQAYTARSPENVADELAFLERTVRPDHIWFADDIFGLKPGWVARFASIVNERGIRIPFKIQSRADLLTHAGTAEALARAGCAEVWIGAESGSQKILNAMDKGTTLGQIAEARSLLRRHNVRASFFLQFGYPGETAADIRATIGMVNALLPDDIGISVSYPLPGTKFYERVCAELSQKQNWIDSDDLALMYRGTYPPEYYRRLHRYVHKLFRTRRAFAALGDAVRLHARPDRRSLRSIVRLPYYLPAAAVDRLLLALLARGSETQVPPASRTDPEEAGQAFSAQAPLFDEIERANPILQWMRGQVHRHMEAYVRPGDSILDISAGTGIDAVHFARTGCSVRALDVAQGMVDEIRKKTEALGLSGLVSAERRSYTEPLALQGETFDHVLSNFGGLNCTPDLEEVARRLTPVLHRGSTVTMVVMPPVCPWEVLHCLKGSFRFAFRRFRRHGTDAAVEGHHFLTYYFSPRNVVRAFGNNFSVMDVRGLASISPPPYLDRFARRFPRLYRFLTSLDAKLASLPPFNRWADHCIITLRYAPGGG